MTGFPMTSLGVMRHRRQGWVRGD